MEPHHNGLDAVHLLLQCHQLDKELAASVGLSVDESHALTQLYFSAPCCVKELRALLFLEPTRMSKILGDLEKRGLITRALGFPDKRKESLGLTPAGERSARHILDNTIVGARRMLGALPHDTARLLTASLTQEMRPAP
jgi:DNA-binding MarR family transcriptional regulator